MSKSFKGGFSKILQRLTDKIPLWVYNVLAIVSATIAIVTFIAGLITWLTNRTNAPSSNYWILSIVVLVGTTGVLTIRIFKYRKLLRERIKMTSSGLHDLTHSFRDAFFDILHEYKLGILNKIYW